MAEATTPQAGVPPAAPSIENRLQSYFARQEEAPAEAEQDETPPAAEPAASVQAPVEATPTDELTPEDLPDPETPTQPNAADEFEIVHNGTQHKLPRAEVIKLAQQGFDYTQKTQVVAERTKALDGALKRVAELEQMAPLVLQEQAQVSAVKAQIDQYKDVNWVQLATDQPLDYPRYRAQYDLLVQGYNQSVNNLNQAAAEAHRRRQEVAATVLQQEFQRLPELVPEWKDAAKLKAGTQEVANYLLSEGVPEDEVKGINNALVVKIAHKAMLYDKLLKSKSDKAKLLQQAPPVTRPGVANTAQSAQADKEQALARKFKKSGTVEDAAALYLQRMNRAK